MEALATCSAKELEALADRILEDCAVEVLEGPEVAVAPIHLPGPEGAGTVVVGRAPLTRCAVELDGVRGDGLYPGRAPRGALAAAVLDAEVERGGRLAPEVEVLVLAAVDRRRRALAEEAEAVEATRIGGTP